MESEEETLQTNKQTNRPPHDPNSLTDAWLQLSDVKNAERLGFKIFHSRLDTTDPFKRLRI